MRKKNVRGSLWLLCCLFLATGGVFAESTLIIEENAPDPHVLNVDGKYYLYATPGEGDIPVWVANDLNGPWQKRTVGVFNKPFKKTLELNGEYYKSVWAPDVVQLDTNSFMLSFSATKHGDADGVSLAKENGVYFAWSSSPTGPFALFPHEPIPAGASPSCANRDNLPQSVEWATPGCPHGPCENTVRLDGYAFKDGGNYWLGYSWYTSDQYDPIKGEHSSIVKLDSSDPFVVACNASPIFIGNCRDTSLITKLRNSCDNVAACEAYLSNTKDKYGNEWSGGGVVEGVSLIKANGYYYALMSGSTWDSAYYHVYWVAATTIEGLRWDNPGRLVGRFLVPGKGNNGRNYSFGHGSTVQDGDDNWHYVYGALDHTSCLSGDCKRVALKSPIEFVDKGDGKGRVHIKTVYPVLDFGV